MSIHQLINIWAVSTFWLLWVMLPYKHPCTSFYVVECFYFSGLGGVARSHGNSLFSRLRTCQTVPMTPAAYEAPSFPASSPNTRFLAVLWPQPVLQVWSGAWLMLIAHIFLCLISSLNMVCAEIPTQIPCLVLIALSFYY